MQAPQQGLSDRFTVRINRDLEDIVPIFLSNRKKDIQTLRLALGDKDFKAIQMLGHRMKGDGGGYGFSRISEIGAAMEHGAERRESASVERHIAELEEFLAQVQVIYI